MQGCSVHGLLFAGASTLQTDAAAAPAQLSSPPPPPIAFASNTNFGSGGGGSSDSSFSSTSTIGDVFTYEANGGGSIESAGPVGPTTTALTVKNGAVSSMQILFTFSLLPALAQQVFNCLWNSTL
jgi:hypothetical protein